MEEKAQEFKSVLHGFEYSSSFFVLCWCNCMFNGTFVLFCNFDRIWKLAEPKKAACANDLRPLYLYSCGRESMIREHPSLVDFHFPSDRLVKLAEPKQYQAAYLLQRPRTSPEWPVSPAALNCKASPRIVELAQPKVLHPEFLPTKKVPTQVTNAAALARASSRIQQLAEPWVKKVTCCYEYGPFESAILPVSKFAQEAIASPRTLELAMAKRLHPDYIPMRDAAWSVTKAAKQAVATPRLVELAQPCKSDQASLCTGIINQRIFGSVGLDPAITPLSFLSSVLILLLATWPDHTQLLMSAVYF
ncbi:sperm microtubule associated protein 2-like isoform 2-T2 [Amazona ochrocephala]